MRIDLHIHSAASDGLLRPAELVQAVRDAHLDVFSVTDHDTIDALAEVEVRARGLGLRLVPGVELSAFWRKRVEVHILGYFVDPKNAMLNSFLKDRRGARRIRLQAMLSRLRALGIAIEAAEVLARANEGNVGRPHLARVLVEHGIVSNSDEAFARYLGEGKPGYVPRPDVSVADAIHLIREAGGLASLAHPGLHNRDDAIPEMMAEGLDAIEVYHAKHGPGQVTHYRRLAKRRGLLVTGGSDFHGAVGLDYGLTPGTPCLPEADFFRLEAAAETRRSTRASSPAFPPRAESR